MRRLCAVFLGLSFALGITNATLAQEKTLKYAVSQEFESMNPIIMQQAVSSLISYGFSRPLMSLDTDWKWVCHLCVTIPSLENGLAKMTTDKDVKKIEATWEIKKEAVWGDGTPITGEDFKLAWEIGKSPNVTVGSHELYDRVEDIVIDSANPKIFTMKFKQARYDFYQQPQFYPMPRHVEGAVWEKTKTQQGAYEKQTKYTTEPTNVALYSGPYVLDEVKHGSHVIAKKNPKFYGSPAKIDRIIYKIIGNTQTLEANLLSGEVDMISELGMSMDQALAFEKRLGKEPALGAKFNVVYREGMTYEHITLNLRNPILKDGRVRQALLYAIDRDKLTTALFQGKQKPALHGVHPMDPYYSDKVHLYPFDATRANALLEDAGWKLGPDKYRYKDGKKLRMQIMTTAQNKTREQVQVWLQGEWKKIGVELTIRNEIARVFFGETVRKAKFEDMVMFAWVGSPDNPPRTMFHSSEIPSQKNGFSGQNSSGFADKEVDRLLDEIILEFDFAKRKEMMAKIQEASAEQLPDLPLFLRSEIAVTPKSMTGFELSGHQFYSTLNIENWNF